MQKNHFSSGGLTEKIIVLSRLIEHAANHEVLEKLGISLAGYEIMHILHFHSAAEPSVLAQFLGSGKSNITQRVNILMKSGLVAKAEAQDRDGRKAPIKLTEKGEKLFQRAKLELDKITDDLEKKVGKKEVKAYSPFLNKLFEVLLATHNQCCPKQILKAMKEKIILPLIIISLSLTLAGCGKKEEVKIEKQPITVKAQTAEDSRQIDERVEYAAMVYPQEEALVIAKAGGTATQASFKLGDKIKAGDVLIKIDDASGKNPAGNFAFNAAQVRQAQIAVQQAYSSLLMAQVSYQNQLNSSASVASENYRAAEIAYETAQLATQQAKINLDSRQKQVGLSSGDTSTNSASAADTAANICDTIINGLYNSLSLDSLNPNYLPYAPDLGVLDSSILRQAKDAYRLTKAANDNYKLGGFANTAAQVKSAIDLAAKTKNLTDLSKRVLDKTTASAALPQASLSGTSLNSLIAMVSSYQSQANGALAQANGAKQSLENTELGNDSSLSLLQKTYELAQKQEAAARQNLNTLKASQSSQLAMAELQYINAVAALQGLYDSHLAIAPISGTITQKNIDNGSTISPGQILAAVSRTDQMKIQFFTDEENLKYMKPGQKAEIVSNGGEIIPGKIANLTPQADQVSKKFLVEVKPDSATSTASLTAGTVVSVIMSLNKKTTVDKTVILPLSAIEITQNKNYVFTVENGLASQTPVEILKVDGESAQVKLDKDLKTLIITDGNKLVRNGDSVKIQ